MMVGPQSFVFTLAFVWGRARGFFEVEKFSFVQKIHCAFKRQPSLSRSSSPPSLAASQTAVAASVIYDPLFAKSLLPRLQLEDKSRSHPG